MDKIRFLIMAGVLAVLLGTAVIELNAESIQVGDYTGNVGDIISVKVTANGTDIIGLSFDLIFDNTKLYALRKRGGFYEKRL